MQITPFACRIHARTSARAENILGTDLNPNGRAVSTYTYPTAPLVRGGRPDALALSGRLAAPSSPAMYQLPAALQVCLHPALAGNACGSFRLILLTL